MTRNSHLKWLTMLPAVVLLLAAATTSFASQNVTDEDALLRGKVTLQQLIAYAYRHNPSLKAARMRWAAVIERHPQVTAYEDPVLQYAYFIENVETRVGPQEQKFSLSQDFPLPGDSLSGQAEPKGGDCSPGSKNRPAGV